MRTGEKCPKCGKWMRYTLDDFVIRYVCACGHAIEYDEEE
jgi:ssDNA-binding Zn-finger/Zn-ribbon topoisomerase 1